MRRAKRPLAKISYLELSLPLVLRPHRTVSVIIDRGHHLRHPAKMSRTIHGKKQVDGSVALPLPVGLVEAFVAVLGAAPDLVLDAPVDVVLRVGLDDEEPGVGSRQVEL